MFQLKVMYVNSGWFIIKVMDDVKNEIFNGPFNTQQEAEAVLSKTLSTTPIGRDPK